MLWIEYRKGENIPKDLYYQNYQTYKDKSGKTPLMYWIRYHQGEDIPK